MSLLILYKNASRSNLFVDCKISFVQSSNSLRLKDILDSYKEEDCIVPQTSSTNFTPCKLRVRVCNKAGKPFADAMEGVTPEFYIRTDRGLWNVFHKESLYLIPDTNFTVQLCTKEKSNILKAALCLEFIHDSKIIASSELLLVLSKPPSTHKNIPFARSQVGLPIDGASPSRWIKDEKKYLLTSEEPTKEIKPWKIISLGSYRTRIPLANVQEQTIPIKRKREEPEITETEILRHTIEEMKKTIQSLETEKIGLVKAIQILNHSG
jgi:hypothetical protein